MVKSSEEYIKRDFKIVFEKYKQKVLQSLPARAIKFTFLKDNFEIVEQNIKAITKLPLSERSKLKIDITYFETVSKNYSTVMITAYKK